MITYNIPKLERIIKHYKLKSRKPIDSHIVFCKAQKNLKEAIEVAVNSIDENNKIHFHQRRIEKSELNRMAEGLLLREAEVTSAQNFDEVFEIIDATKNQYITAITVYDITQRIGAYLGIFPEKIYLQSGTRTGAENLLGNLGDKKHLLREELPSPFQRSDFTLEDIEDILFQYKDEFKYCVK